jgi:hypothetical protein
VTTAELDRKMSALERANEIRRYRKDLKVDLAEGHVGLFGVLRSEDPMLDTMRVRDLLLATPKLGDAKVRRVLDANRIGSSLRLQDFPAWRREALIRWISDNHPSQRGQNR